MLLQRLRVRRGSAVRALWALSALAALSACAHAPIAPPVAPAPIAPVLAPLDKRVANILRLEDQRWLDDGAGASLSTAMTDPDSRVRRRAAIAVGRVGVDAGVPLLVTALGDADKDVRAAAAFGLGLIRAKSAVDVLITALADTDQDVRARSADALGMILQPAGARPAAAQATASSPAAAAIAAMAAGCRAQIAALIPDDERPKISPEIDACRAAILALARMREYDALAKVVIDEAGQPVSTWWPVAYSLQRVGDKRAATALAKLVNVDAVDTPSFAMAGLGAYGDRSGIVTARAVLQRRSADVRVRVAAVRMLARLKDAASIPVMQSVLDDAATPPNLLLETVAALGAIGDVKAFDTLTDLFSSKWAPMRAASVAAAAKLDPDAFLILVSGLTGDKEWSVRAALVETLATLDPARVRALLGELANEADPRVQAPALQALAKVGAPDIDARLAAALEAPDFNLRATAAGLIADRKSAGAAEKLAAAYTRGLSDANSSARAAAIDALAKLGKDAAAPTLQTALGDADWAVRMRAADLLHKLGDADAQPKRPAPLRFSADYYESPALLRPLYSPHAFIETKYGTIEIELNVVEAPLATQSFVALARKGYFNGMRIHRVVPNFVVQAGDDRGDGAGGPGYSLRDELSPLQYLRGTVGMALDGKDSGGSQFFITVSPQPHLNGGYAIFGEVVRGMEIVDQLTLWDVIDRIRVWDGVSFGSQ